MILNIFNKQYIICCLLNNYCIDLFLKIAWRFIFATINGGGALAI